MGWSLYVVSKKLLCDIVFSSDNDLLGKIESCVVCGAIYGKGTAIESMTKISEEVLDLIEKHKPHIFLVENYQYIPGKTNGGAAIPSLITLLRYHWYKCTDTDAHLPYTQTWKSAILRSQCAVKMEIREYVKAIFPRLYKDMESAFNAVGHQGEQDSIDAVAIGLYGTLLAAQILRESKDVVFE